MPIRRISRQFKEKQRAFRKPSAGNAGRMLDSLLVVDRILLESSMNLYNISPRARSSMREHTRRLHRALRRCLLDTRKPECASKTLLQSAPAGAGHDLATDVHNSAALSLPKGRSRY